MQGNKLYVQFVCRTCKLTKRCNFFHVQNNMYFIANVSKIGRNIKTNVLCADTNCLTMFDVNFPYNT